VLNKHSKIPGGNIGIFIAEKLEWYDEAQMDFIRVGMFHYYVNTLLCEEG